MNIRIGFGFDVHQLADGRDFWLGGICIPSEKGMVAHSDGDVLIHAICDALLGAANLRDIGFHFPDTSSDFKGIDSKLLLQKTCRLLKEHAFRVINIDSTVCLELPKLKEHIRSMQDTLAPIIGIDPDCISIKATTNEKMGYVGRREGIHVYAVALIEKMG